MAREQAVSTKRVKGSTGAKPKRQRAPRLASAVRKAMIIEEAARFFAKHGFAASTRDLADTLGIRQALLYKYFDTKDALIEAVLKANFDCEWHSRWSIESATPPSEQAGVFLAAHANDPVRLRLFIRAVLDGDHFSDRIIKAAGFQSLL